MLNIHYETHCLFFKIYAIFDIFGSRLRGKHDVLVPVTPYLAGIFQYLRKNKKLPPVVRAVDMRHILLLHPFLMNGLLADVVQEHNRNYPLRPVYDPSKELIELPCCSFDGICYIGDGFHQGCGGCQRNDWTSSWW